MTSDITITLEATKYFRDAGHSLAAITAATTEARDELRASRWRFASWLSIERPFRCTAPVDHHDHPHWPDLTTDQLWSTVVNGDKRDRLHALDEMLDRCLSVTTTNRELVAIVAEKLGVRRPYLLLGECDPADNSRPPNYYPSYDPSRGRHFVGD